MTAEPSGSLARILVVEDESGIADNITYALKTDGFEPIWADTAGKALALLDSESVSLIILDVGLPDMNGFEVCKRIRKTSCVPVIFLTARNEEIDRVVGLEIGGDDYMVKPFSPRELSARVRAILRRTTVVPTIKRTTRSSAEDQKDKLFTVDDATKTIAYTGLPLQLSQHEFRLLSVLVAHPGRVFSRTELMDRAWDEPEFCTERTVDAHIKSIRAKLRAVAPNDDPIETRRGFGYALRNDV